MMISLEKEVFNLLGVAIGNRRELTSRPTDEEWEELHSVCEEQLLLALAFIGIERLPKEQLPPLELYDKWKEEVQEEEDIRKTIVKKCKETCEAFDRNGFYSCVLMPRLAQVRGERLEVRDERLEFLWDPRDIDILCWSKDKKDGKRTIVEYVNFQYVSSTRHVKPKVERLQADY